MLSRGQIRKINKRIRKETGREFKDFKTSLRKDECYLCGLKFSSFNIDKPCIHWLLRPEGFKKKHFPSVYKKFDYFQIQAYFRWLANSEVPFRNINDLVEEKSLSKIIENTIKYKNLEWSFSSSPGDYSGHKFRFHGRFPHYHFQMKINGKIFIRYSDFHIPFIDKDLWTFKVKQGQIKGLEYTFGYGVGMQELLDNFSPEEILNLVSTTDDYSKSPLNLTTIIKANSGKTISGDEVANLIKEGKRTGIPLAKLIRKLKNVKAQTIITPGEGVPQISGRRGGRKKKKEKRPER